MSGAFLKAHLGQVESLLRAPGLGPIERIGLESRRDELLSELQSIEEATCREAPARFDVEIIKALGLGLGAAAEVALKHGWDEASFLKLAGLVFRHERDGSSSRMTSLPLYTSNSTTVVVNDGIAQVTPPAGSGGCSRA